MSLTQAELTRLEILVSFIEEGSGGPVSSEEVDRAEQTVGRPFPPALRHWIESVDAAILAEGNLHVSPLWGTGEADDQVRAIATGTAALRASGWDLPEELLLFATDGGETRFGLWLGDDDTANAVVALRDRPLPGAPAYWIVGESLLAFLTGWSAAHAHLHHGAVYELLQVPGELQRPVDEHPAVDDAGRAVAPADPSRSARLLQFASPSAPAIAWPADPADAFTAEALRGTLRELPRAPLAEPNVA